MKYNGLMVVQVVEMISIFCPSKIILPPVRVHYLMIFAEYLCCKLPASSVSMLLEEKKHLLIFSYQSSLFLTVVRYYMYLYQSLNEYSFYKSLNAPEWQPFCAGDSTIAAIEFLNILLIILNFWNIKVI